MNIFDRCQTTLKVVISKGGSDWGGVCMTLSERLGWRSGIRQAVCLAGGVSGQCSAELESRSKPDIDISKNEFV